MKDRVRAVGFYAKGETQWRAILRDTLAGILQLNPRAFVMAVTFANHNLCSYASIVTIL